MRIRLLLCERVTTTENDAIHVRDDLMSPLQEPHVQLVTRENDRRRCRRTRDEGSLDGAVNVRSETRAIKDHTEGISSVSILKEREDLETHTPARPWDFA